MLAKNGAITQWRGSIVDVGRVGRWSLWTRGRSARSGRGVLPFGKASADVRW